MNQDDKSPAPASLLPLAPTDFQVLLLLAARPLHPYGISKTVDESPELGVVLGIGSLYRMLNRMMSAGLIEEAEGVDVDEGPAGRRRVFRITPFGRRVARAEARRLEAVVEAARAQNFLPQKDNG